MKIISKSTIGDAVSKDHAILMKVSTNYDTHTYTLAGGSSIRFSLDHVLQPAWTIAATYDR